MTSCAAHGRPAGIRRAAAFILGLACAASGCARDPLLRVERVDVEGLAARVGPGVPGKPRLVNYWATWCPPCVAELPHLVEVAHEHRDEALVVAVSMDLAMPHNKEIAGPADVEAFARSRGFDLPILVLDGTAEAAGERLDLPGPLPYTVAIDSSGQVVATAEEGASRERFEEMLDAAMR